MFEAFWSDDPAAALMHGPTFMANPLACAAANASLDLFDREPRLAQAQAISRALEAGLAPLRGCAGVADVRVLGAIGAVQLAPPVDLAALKRALLARGRVGAAVRRGGLSHARPDHRRRRPGHAYRRGDGVVRARAPG